MKYLLFITVLLIWLVPFEGLAANNFKIAGQVLNAKTNQPLQGANVILENYGGASTDSEGRFSFNRVPRGSYTLRVTFMGFRPFEQQFLLQTEGKLIKVRLEPTVIPLDSIQVVADRFGLETKLLKTGPSSFHISQKEFQKLPIPFEPDLLRALHSFPGVTEANELTGQINVRGGTFDQNLILLDGMPLYNPLHCFALGSTFNTDALEEAFFSTGGFPAIYGSRLSSVLSVKSRRGADSLHARAAMSFATSKITSWGSFKKRVFWVVSARRTYIDGITDLAGQIFPYHFYDLHGSSSIQLGKSMSLAFTFFSSQDRFQRDKKDSIIKLDREEPESEYRYKHEYTLKWSNNVYGAEWSHQVCPSLHNRILIYQSTAGNRFINMSQALIVSNTSPLYFGTLDSLDSYYHAKNENAENLLTDRTVCFDIIWNGAKWLTAFAGARYSHFNFDYGWENLTNRSDIEFDFFDHAPFGDFTYENQLRSSQGYVELLAALSAQLSLRQGLRIGRWNGDSKLYFEPRTGLEFKATSTLSLSCAAGLYSQGIATARERGLLAYMDLYFPSTNPIEKATHYIVGVHFAPTQNTSLKLEGYYKDFRDLLLSTGPSPDFARINGSAYGTELTMEVLSKSWQAQLFYAFAKNTRNHNGYIYPPNFDQRHRVHFSGSISLGKNWTFKALWLFHTGQPYDPGFYTSTIRDVALDIKTGEPTYRSFTTFESSAARGSIRYPYYHRLDIELRKTFRKGKWRISPFINIYNAYFRKNVLYYSQNPYYEPASSGKLGTPKEEFTSANSIPIFPSVGVAVEF